MSNKIYLDQIVERIQWAHQYSTDIKYMYLFYSNVNFDEPLFV